MAICLLAVMRGGRCAGSWRPSFGQQQAMVFFGLGVARKDEPAAIGGREAGVKPRDGGEFLDHGARGQPRSVRTEAVAQRDMQRVGEESQQDVSFDSTFEPVKDGADGQITFEIFERFLDLGQQHVKLPEQGRIAAGQIAAKQAAAFTPADLAQLFTH